MSFMALQMPLLELELTLRTTLQAFWYYIIRNPETLAQLRSGFGLAASQGKLSQVVSYAEALELPFLQELVGF